MRTYYLLLLGIFTFTTALDNGLGRKPQMGWNSWNFFGCNINENIIRDTVDALAQNHVLRKAGYNYINVDDCWAESRDSNGKIVPDKKTFPNGMKALADYTHSKGLKFGLYSDAGTMTCERRPGSLGYERQDAESYASWNVDYLKYDNCFNEDIPSRERYPPMRDALNATGRPIFYSICEWGSDDPATWATTVGNSWRTTEDIKDNWASVLKLADENNKWAKYAGPGAWNDPDMLEVGNGGMTLTEYRSHFSLWSLMKAPLIIGCDLRNMSKETIDILTAPEVIAVNQDNLGVQGQKITSEDNLEVWGGPLAHHHYVAILFNRSSQSASITAKFSDLGLSGTQRVRDLWLRKDLGSFSNSFTATVPSHGVVMIRLARA